MLKAIRVGRWEVIASTQSWCRGSITSILEPARRHSSATVSTAAGSVPSSGVRMHQRPSNRLSKPASGPDFSVPAMGWAGTKGTPSGRLGTTASITACFTEPTSVTIWPAARAGAIALATASLLPTGVDSTISPAPRTASATSRVT